MLLIKCAWFLHIEILFLLPLASSLFIVRRESEADWFKKTGNIKCADLNAYSDSKGDGCRCHYGNTLSTEAELMCKTYEERGNLCIRNQYYEVLDDVTYTDLTDLVRGSTHICCVL